MNSINDLTDSLESLSPAIPKGHVRLVFENLYVSSDEEVIGVEESKEESENYAKVNFYQDIPLEIVALSDYMNGSDFTQDINDLSSDEDKTTYFYFNITRERWDEIYALMNLLLEVKQDSACTTDLDIIKTLYLRIENRYATIDDDSLIAILVSVDSFGIRLLSRAFNLFAFNRWAKKGEYPPEIKKYKFLEDQLNELEAATHSEKILDSLFDYDLSNSELLPQPYFNLEERFKKIKDPVLKLYGIQGIINQYQAYDGITDDLMARIEEEYPKDAEEIVKFLNSHPIMQPYTLKQLVEHFNHPMMKQFKHVRIELLKKYISNLRKEITTQKAAGTLPPLAKLIEEHKAQPGSHEYIAVFILYCLTHTEEELTNKQDDLESLTHGETLFQIAQRIKKFNNTHDALDLGEISRIGAVLEKLLDILQGLTTGPINNLYLHDNKLTEVPNSIGYLTRLTWLYLPGNKLEELPDSIIKLTQLTWLDLSYNLLTEVPNSIGYLTQLIVLSLDDNELTIVPDSIGNLTQLKVLILSHNKLEELPNSIGNLTQLAELYLHRNKLTIIPNSIGKLTELTRLYLNDNELPILPDSIGNLTQLKDLFLFNNKLTKIPAGLKLLKRQGLEIV